MMWLTLIHSMTWLRFFKYGEDKFSKQIARKIEQARAIKPIETTTELAELIKAAKPAKELKKKVTLQNRFFKPSALKLTMNLVQLMSLFRMLWNY